MAQSSEDLDLHNTPNGATDMGSERKVIRSKVLKRVSLDPWFVFPCVGGAGTGAWMLINGFTPWGWLITMGLVSVGGCNWLWNWVTKGPKYSQEEGEKLLAKYLAAKEQALDELEVSCEKARFPEGVQIVRDLEKAYKHLCDASAAENRSDERLAAFLVLAEEAFQEGISVVRQALAVHKASMAFDSSAAEAEIQTTEEEIAELGSNQSARRELLDRKIEVARERLQKHQRALDGRQIMLTRASEICAVLEGSSLEVADVLNVDDTVATRETGAANRLSIALQAAREARELGSHAGGLDYVEIDRRLGADHSPKES